MNKKGQFYIIIVLIIGVAIYGISSEVNKIEEVSLFEDFSELSQNYVGEAPKVVNYAIQNDDPVNPKLDDFTEEFMSLAKKKIPDIGLFYIYSNGSNLTFRSYLGETVLVSNPNPDGSLYLEETVFGSEDEVLDTISINVGGKKFIRQVPVEIKNYGESFSSGSVPSSETEWISLNIGGIFHNFKVDSGQSNTVPTLDIILKSNSSISSQIYSTGNPNIPWNPI